MSEVNEKTEIVSSQLVESILWEKKTEKREKLIMNKEYCYAAVILLSLLTIAVQPARATIYLTSAGWSNPEVGTWDGETTTATLTQDVSETIQIDVSGTTLQNVVLDGAGHTVSGPFPDPGPLTGVYLNNVKCVTIKNLNVTNWYYGIWLYRGTATSTNHNVIDNTVSTCVYGILVTRSDDNAVTGNNVSARDYGISLGNSDNNTVTGNEVYGSTAAGIWLDSAIGNNIGNNIIRDITSISVNGNGISAQNCGSNTLTSNSISDNDIGIKLFKSTYFSITGNDISNNTDTGIHLQQSSNNELTGNDVTGNDANGITLKDSSNNTLTNNTVSDNTLYGIWLDPSVNNQINNNNFIANTTQAYVDDDSTVNNIDGNYWSDWGGSGAYVILSTPSGDEIADNSPFAQPNGWLPNQPPVADAGPDQTVECVCRGEFGTLVTLDASNSSDPDQDPLTYTWTGPFVDSPKTVSDPALVVTLNVCLGEHTISLVVNDGTVDSDPDTVVITVQDTTAPDMTAPGDITVEAMDPDGVPIDDDEIQTFLDGVDADDDCTVKEQITITNDAPDVFLPGDTVVTFAATDASGNTATCESTVTVVEAAESHVRIAPRIINREGRLQKILAVIRFPEGTAEEDIDMDVPLVLYPGDSQDGIEATHQRIVTWQRWGTLRVCMLGFFDKDDVTTAVPEDGWVELTAVGRFVDGQYFYGTRMAKIVSWIWKCW